MASNRCLASVMICCGDAGTLTLTVSLVSPYSSASVADSAFTRSATMR
jgi:hypothetical protein